jgi:hypothetical protein
VPLLRDGHRDQLRAKLHLEHLTLLGVDAKVRQLPHRPGAGRLHRYGLDHLCHRLLQEYWLGIIRIYTRVRPVANQPQLPFQHPII